MVRRTTPPPLGVFLNSRPVGRLQRHASGAIDFQYDATWLDWPHALPVSLSLPLRGRRYSGAPVLAVFDNLLPDNEAIRRQMAERAGAAGDDAFSLLAAIGRDCVGALQFLPDGLDPGPVGAITGRDIDDAEIARKLANLARAPLGMGDDPQFRISIAGAQEKTALLRWQNRWRIPHGTTATTHILKPQIGRLRNGIDLSRSVENEYLCLRLCAAFGLPTARADIVDFADQRALVVERFDRLHTQDGRLLRRPQEDCCQALGVPPTGKYEAEGGPGLTAIAGLLGGSDDPAVDRANFLKAHVVFWLLAATDGHGKNFSLALHAAGRFRLAPLYDVMSAQPHLDAGQIRHNQAKLAMAVGHSRRYVMGTISPRHFAESGVDCRIPEATVRTIFDDLMRDGSRALAATLADLPRDFPDAVATPVANGVRARLGELERYVAMTAPAATPLATGSSAIRRAGA